MAAIIEAILRALISILTGAANKEPVVGRPLDDVRAELEKRLPKGF